MKFKFTFLFLILSVAVMSGCASGPTFKEYSSSIPVIPEESGRIYIYRTSTFGAVVQPSIRINGEAVGKAVPKGFFFVDLPAGNYKVSASTEAKRSLTLNLESGEERYVRLEVKMGVLAGHIKPVLVENAVGKEEITKTKYMGN
ncbi:MAG: DUF2846 domain-containing protein [Xanthomonadales bacterium]|nr:DUF2846 domain-containing protein [Xanthomonadales bacterium]